MTTPRILNRLLIVCVTACTFLAACHKSHTSSSPAYDFSWYWLAQQYAGIPSYASVYPFGFSSNVVTGNAVLWDFGDGTTSTVLEPTHDFTDTGTFKITLTVNSNAATAVTKYLTVSTYLPHTFYYSGTRLPDSSIQFTSNVSGDSTFLWNFGDGGTSNNAIPKHAYTASGTYNVQLTINGNPATTVALPITIVADPGHTSMIAGVRSWHDTDVLYSSGGTTLYPQHDTSFAITYVNPITVQFGSSVLTYNPAGSTANSLDYGSSYTDNTGNNHSIDVYYYYTNDSIVVRTYARISAGGSTGQIWSSY